jgi:RNA polymerase sigma-70 factor (ECF subfamily)
MLLLFVLAAFAAVDPVVAREAAALVALALSGRGQAGRVLTHRLLPVIRARVGAHFARRAGQAIGAHDAEDMVQDIWATLLQDDGRLLRAYDPARGMTLEGYVGLLCRRELWRRGQEAGRLKRGGQHALEAIDDPLPDGGALPEDEAVGRDLLAGLLAHLRATLPARGRAVLSYVYEDARDPREAAEALGVNLQVVYNWQHRIRQESRAFLAENGVAVAD